MAIDPATAKALTMLAKKILTDKETRQKVLVFLMLPLILILIILASPVAILFGTTGETTENEGTPISEFMAELSSELTEKILEEQNDDNMDEVHVIYMGSEGESINNTGHVLALFSVDTCLTSVSDEELTDIESIQEISGNMQVANLSNKQKKQLKELYWSMNSIEVEVITIECTDEKYPDYTDIPTPTPKPEATPSPTPTLSPEEEEELEVTPSPTPRHEPSPSPTPTPAPYYIKNIYVTCLSYEDVVDDFDFNDEQLQVLDEFVYGDYAYLFAIAGSNTTDLTVEEIQAIKDSLPSDLSIERENIVLSAYSLVNKVDYFWGGKSYAIGWDSRWGTPTLVTADGSKSTGTIRSFGLDCSGYVAWVYLNSGFPEDVIKSSFGRSTKSQWQYSLPVDISAVQIGDLAFKCVPSSGVNHVGVVVGYDDDGDLMIAHCTSSKGVVITGYKRTFKFFRRAILLD